MVRRNINMPFYFPFSRYPYSYQYRSRRPYYPHSAPRGHGDSSNADSSAEFSNSHTNCSSGSIGSSTNSVTDFKEEKRGSTSKNRITPNSNTISNLFSFLPTSIGPLNFHPEAFNDIDEPLFEMFGISLYLDDIIIVCILIFLYQEGVKDDMLYISLFLLLIS